MITTHPVLLLPCMAAGVRPPGQSAVWGVGKEAPVNSKATAEMCKCPRKTVWCVCDDPCPDRVRGMKHGRK